MLSEAEILRLIGEGENQIVEFKREPTDRIGEEICAMANAEGGYIFVGIDDDKTPVGTDIERAKRVITSQAVAISPPVKINFQPTEILDKPILIIIVPKSDKIHTIGGRAFIRIGTSKRPLDITEIIDRGSELAIIPADTALTELSTEDMWKEAVERFKDATRRRGSPVENVIDYLKKIGAIRKGRLTLAAALMFTKRPQERWPHTYVRVISGKEWKRIDGPLWEIVEEAYGEIMERVPKREVYTGARREDIPAVPPEAIREALVNAVTHRNYTHFSEVFIEINGTRITIKNPGSFPPGITPEKPQPKPRNPLIYELMYQMGYVERRGRGIELIKNVCKSRGVDVKIETEGEFTTITFSFATGVDERLNRVLEILRTGPKSAKEIAERLEVSRVTALKIVKQGEQMGIIKKIGSGPRTKYALRD